MRADRLVSMMLLLHNHGRMTVRQLADSLEVSERTLYRDIEALTVAGIPICTQPGVNGGVFLDENYRVSLTGLNRDEAGVLLTFAQEPALKHLGLSEPLQSALRKLTATLPDSHRLASDRLTQRFHIDPKNWFQTLDRPSFFLELQQAVWEDRVIRVMYHPVENQRSERLIEAHGLVCKANVWYLVGRRPEPAAEMHNYRISRFEAVTVLPDSFTRDPNFQLAVYWRESCLQFERQQITAQPRFIATFEVSAENYWHFPAFLEGMYKKVGEPASDGWQPLEVTFTSEHSALRMVLSLGLGVRNIHPTHLAEQRRQEILAIAKSLS
jgi:predicted DNA-binding transcriptional regulator YafY